jgi:hypothetical protein
MKYIFIAGAPGSKWSSVAKNIYYSPSIDRSDFSLDRTYFHDATGLTELMHLGAYWDPGMEFGDWFGNDNGFGKRTKQEHEAEFDRPFLGSGVRIIKSHWFSYRQNIDFIKHTWPECPLVLVHRPDDACLGWWVKCGHFNISYPNYQHYRDLRFMGKVIEAQNIGITNAMSEYQSTLTSPTDNCELCQTLGIEQPSGDYRQNYARSDVTVKVIV